MQRYFARKSGQHVHVHETGFTAQNICLSHSSTKDPVKVSMHGPVHCDCTAARLPCVLTLLKIQASIHVHVHELYSAEYPCMVKVCAPGQRHVYMYITKMTRTRANFTSLVCTAFLLSVVCYAAQERQKASWSGSPQNALHCLVIKTLGRSMGSIYCTKSHIQETRRA